MRAYFTKHVLKNRLPKYLLMLLQLSKSEETPIIEKRNWRKRKKNRVTI